MKIVIVGDGKVGLALTEQLSKEGHDLTVIDNNRQVLGESSERFDVMTVYGNGISMRIQKQAGVPESDLLIAATSADEINILCCIVAKKIGCKRTIARVRTPDLVEQLHLMGEDLGLSMTINPEKAAANEISRMLRFPSFLKRDTFAKGRAQIVELILKKGNPLEGKRLRDLYDIAKIHVLICAVKRGEQTYIPDGNFVLQGNDKIYATAPTNSLDKFIRLMGLQSKKIKSVLMIGGSRIAYYLSADLLAAGIEVKIIEQREDRCKKFLDLLPKVVVIKGDGTNKAVLQSEGIEDVDAVITLTNIDEENLIVSMYANYVGVPKVITKVNRMEYHEVFADKGIDCVVSPKMLTADTIVRYVRSMYAAEPEAMIALYRIADGMAEAMEFIATEGTHNLGRALKDIQLKPQILLACIVRGNKVIIPRGDDTIENGDSVFVVSSQEHRIAELNDIFVHTVG